MIVVHEKTIHNAAVSAVHDPRNVSDASNKRNVCPASTRNSLSCRIDVFDLRDNKQERMWKVRIAEIVGIVNMSVICGERSRLPSLSAMVMIRDCGD